MNRRTFTARRELDHRLSGGLAITLYWDPAADSLSIEIFQPATGETIAIPVAPGRALEAFHHPFAELAERHAGSEPAPVATG